MKPKRYIVEGILAILIVLTAGDIISNLTVHSAFSKSYYYSDDSNIGMGERMTVKAQTPKVLLVNKEHVLPADYVPENLVMPDVVFAANTADERRKMEPQAAEALEELFAAGQQDGVQLVGVSGFRSYSTQSSLYYRSIRRNGYNYASVYSAQPGKSEHQTGLAIDVSCAEVGYELYSRFAQTKEGIWLAEHCEEYGFIIRYPEGKTDITGYAYEPWHIRYVGTAVAQYLRAHDMTLDEYCGAMPYESYYGLKEESAEVTTENPAQSVTEAATESTNGRPETVTTQAAADATTEKTTAQSKAEKNATEEKKKSSVSAKETEMKIEKKTEAAATEAPATTEQFQEEDYAAEEQIVE